MHEEKDKLIRRLKFLHQIGRVMRADDINSLEVSVLNDLKLSGIVNENEGKYFLPGYEKLLDFEEIYIDRIKYQMNKISKYSFLFNSFPFVKDIAICNTLSQGVPLEESDIDLIIILDPKRFFLGRFIVSILIHLAGVRRHHNRIKDRFCLSFFIADNRLSFNNIVFEDDIYFYYWFYYLNFLYGNYVLQQNLLEENLWFKEKNFEFNNTKYFKSNILSKLLSFFLGLSLFNWLESIMSKVQLRRARTKYESLDCPSGVVVEEGFLKFHVVDVRQQFKKDFYRDFLR
jgi:predicted nucleotidyltransferase